MDDLKLIKKYYGEKMMHLCRELFSTILETPGKLFEILKNNFAYSKYLCDDIIENGSVNSFKNFIYSIFGEIEEINISDKTPQELLKSVGYTLYECKTEEDIQQFKKYYAYGEELCTFKGCRLDTCYVFFAVKDNVDEIRREDFKYPNRQDEYGISVISIQFSKGKLNTLSIKNRYNHTVNNPDATFSNNLENITKGLTDSFNKKYNLNISSSENDFELLNYVKAEDGKYYRYNYEINNIYYCSNNIIIDNFDVKKYNPQEYLVFDYYILDLKNKTIELYDGSISDSFCDNFENIKKIDIKKLKECDIKQVTIDGEYILELNEYNQLISYIDDKTTFVHDYFLEENLYLNRLVMNKVVKIGDSFLYSNKNLSEISLKLIKKIGDEFLLYNTKIEKVYFDKVFSIGNNFFYSNEIINSINMPNLIRVGDNFLINNSKLQILELRNLVKIGSKFLCNNKILQELILPKLKYINDRFLENNECLKCLKLPSLISVGRHFMTENKSLIDLEIPKLLEMDILFLTKNTSLVYLNASSIQDIDPFFLHDNDSLEIAILNNVRILNKFLNKNKTLRVLEIDHIEEILNSFLENNYTLQVLKISDKNFELDTNEYIKSVFEQEKVKLKKL